MIRGVTEIMMIDQISNSDGKIPKEVIIEDKTAVEQLRLIQQLEEEEEMQLFFA